MLRHCFLIVLLLLSTLSLLSCARKATTLSKEQTAITNLIQQFPGNPSIGIFIKNLDTQKIIYQLNSDRTFVPASTLKIVTATAGLIFLGKDYQLTTALLKSGNIKNNILNGSIELHFSGDPSLTSTELTKLLHNLKQQHINTITGNIYINTDQFPAYKPGPGFMWDDLNFCYSAPSTAIILDHNCFKFTLFPSQIVNNKALIKQQKPLTYTPVDNQVYTRLIDEQHCPIDMQASKDNHYQITGCIPYHHAPYHFEVAVHNPQILLTQFLQHWLATQKITLHGKIIVTQKNYSETLIAEHRSASLSKLLKHMLKKSDNLYANVLFKTIGADYNDGLANWINGSAALLDILNTLNMDTENLMIVDGAGLSRYNRLTPTLLMQILDYNYQHPTVGQAFYHALSIAGKDGTLKKFQLQQANTVFHAKTGNMVSVMSLAGYLTMANGQHLAVVIMINGIDASETYFALAHKILVILGTSESKSD
jgi:D-alanyl-D-alanine carboxypeptidase/D-alanyl-D-alanine-endopeptidase (penicillin-binding protein 4)